jgi:hypothetical protein
MEDNFEDIDKELELAEEYSDGESGAHLDEQTMSKID